MLRTPHAPIGNQVASLSDHDAWAADPSARWWLDHLLGIVGAEDTVRDHATALLTSVGTQVGSSHLRDAADRANRNEPQFIAGSDPRGDDDEIRFDPSWDTCIDAVTASGVCALGVTELRAGWIVRAAAMEQWARLDIGVMCPVTMTSAALPLLQAAAAAGHVPAIALADSITAAASDPTRPHPLVGMAMTEPQGGSDLAGSTVRAERVGDSAVWELSGHKWFCSHPTSTALLVLARDPEVPDADAAGTRGLSCFLVPGRVDDARNGIVVQRLKDKLGTRSLASAEVVFERARATRIGDAGRGVPTIMQMVVGTRMDCAIGSAGLLARAVGEAVHAARQRHAFGAALVDQPLMRMVLADLALEREGALALAFDIARGVQQGDTTSGIVTAVGKYWITRRAVAACIECVEVLGGNGYTEEFPLARLYRDAQVNSTWEGSGNVIALDVLRALQRDPDLLPALTTRIEALAADAPADIARDLHYFVAATAAPTGPADARRFVGRLAIALQAALLVHRAGATDDVDDAEIARAFIATRLHPSSERVFGDGDAQLARAAGPLLERHP